MRHKLDLFGNAVDSLNEGLRRYADAQAGAPRAYKFAVLHVAHFAELMLKHVVATEHRLLIYKRPDSRNLTEEPTIGTREAIQILRNAEHVLEQGLVSDLEWLRRLRNQIEHYEFDMDVKEVRATIGRVLRAADAFVKASGMTDLQGSIERDCRETYRTLLDEYLHRLESARADANAQDPEGVANCGLCGETLVAIESDDEVRCLFCKSTERKYPCCICEEVYRESEMSVWNDEHSGPPDYICSYCEDEALGPE